MTKLLITLVAVSGFAICLPAFAAGADSCHFHGGKAASQETVAGCAVKRQQALIASGKIDKAWQAIQPTTFDQVDGQRGKEWKVTFKNPAATDKSKEALYMFFAQDGNFIAANFSGK